MSQRNIAPKSHKMTLNEKQLEAVKYISGPTLVLAGAGSGKTGVITNKIAYLIRDCEYNASNIVALTFTNKAAREMKERVSKMLTKKETKGLWISTFHTLGLRILKEDGKYIGLDKGFSIFDQKDCFEILREITKLDNEEIKKIQTEVSNLKNDVLNKKQHEDNAKAIASIYNNHLLALNSVDFDDLIIHCISLFRDNPLVLEKWRKRVRYLLLDEYQDTNQSQYQFIKYLTEISGHFTAVGDDDQSIYSWRGAEAENLRLLSDDFPNLKVVKLEQNYRCDYRILSSSNALIANNKHIFEKKLWSDIENGEQISVYSCATEDEEAQMLATNIITHSNRVGAKFSDFAVLYRGNFQSRAIEKQLRMHQIPYSINGSTSFFEHSEIRDLIGYMRIIANPSDQRAFVRVVNTPKREIGTATLQKLSEYSRVRNIGFLDACLEYGLSNVMTRGAQQKLYEFAKWVMSLNEKSERGESPTQILEWIIGDVEYIEYIRSLHNTKSAENRIRLVDELKDWVKRLEEKDDIESLSDLINRMQLLDMLEQKADSETDKDEVSLMTLHAAKGLEFPYVFIIGLEEGMLPHQNCISEEELVEEERRLLYVGITRAKRKLWMSLTENRKIAGNLEATTPSRFLAELPQDEIEWSGINEKTLTAKEKEDKLEDIFADLFSIVDNAS